MAWRFHGRATVNPSNPEAFGVCDRCGFWYNHKQLSWQFDWRGNQLTNLRILVCDICLDKPFEHYRPIVVPPDPPPIMNARPEQFLIDEQFPDGLYIMTEGGNYLSTQGSGPLVTEGPIYGE